MATESLELNPELKKLLKNLASLYGEYKPSTTQACRQFLHDWLNKHPSEYTMLRNEMERALSSRAYMKLYLRCLDELQLRRFPVGLLHGLPNEYLGDYLSDERQRQILTDGLKMLTPGELGLMAIDVHQLLYLSDTITSEDQLPLYWQDAVEEAMKCESLQTGKKIMSVEEMISSVRQA